MRTFITGIISITIILIIAIPLVLARVFWQKRFLRATALLLDEKYNEAIEEYNKLKSFSVGLKWLRNQHCAVAWLGLNNREEFVKELAKTKSKFINAPKYFLLTMDKLMNKELESAKINYDIFINAPTRYLDMWFMDKHKKIIYASLAYESGSPDAKAKIAEALSYIYTPGYNRFTVPVIKKYLENALNELTGND